MRRTDISLFVLGALILVGGVLRSAAQALQITAPASGVVVAPGQTVSVTVVSSGGTFSQVGVVAEYPIGFSNLLTAPPFQFSVAVPATAAVGAYHLTAVGAAGQASLIYSQPVTLYVERSDSPVGITVQPSTITFEAQGQQVPIQVTGAFSDGTSQDVTGSSQLSFGSSNGSVAAVSAQGVVSAVGIGNTSISVNFGRAAAAGIPVSVPSLTTTALPASLSFPNTTDGVASASQAVILTNSSSANITLASVAISGDFGETDNCSGQTIASGGTCTITVTFTPTLVGQEGGQLTVVNGFDVVPLTVSLSGTGISVSSATLVANLTDSGNLTIGQSGLTYSLAVNNVGNGPLSGLVTVTESLPSSLTLTALSGSGWSCTLSLAQCSRSDGLAPGNSYPTISATATVSANAPQYVTAAATVVYTSGSASAVYSTSDSELVSPLMQTIAFGPLNNVAMGTPPFAISATASSGLPVTFSSSTNAVCTVSSSTVTIVSIGTCSITASQPGNGTPPAAPSVTQSFTVSAAWQIITFLPLSNVSLGVSPFALNATSSSGLAVSFASTTPSICMVSSGLVSIATVGTCTITASQAGNSTYGAAAPVAQSFTVTITPTVTVTPSASSITTVQPLSVAITVSGGSGNPTPTGTVTLSSGSYSSAATTLSSGSAAINVPAGLLATGSDTLTVSYTPDANSSSTYNTATGTSSAVTVAQAKITPAVMVTPTPGSITTTQALSVAITVSGGNGNPTPTGSVTLVAGTGSFNGVLVNGVATIPVPAGAFAAGTDTLTATYTPDSASSSIYNGVTGSATVVVTNPAKTTPTVKVMPGSGSITTAQPLSVTVTVSGSPTPTGTITLSSGSFTSASTTLSNGSATINVPTGSLSPGSDTLTANYTPDTSSSSTYNSASGSTSVTVSKVTPAVTVTPSASSITTTQALSVAITVSGGNGNPTPTGSVMMTSGSYTSAAATLSNGSATINIPAGSLASGTDTLTASYTPDSNSSSTYNTAMGTSSAVTVTAPAKTTPTVSVMPSPSSITTTQALAATVGVAGGNGNPTPTGSVTLTSGSYISAATTLSSGSVTITVPAGSLSTGSDTLTASYTPDSNSSSIYNSATGTNSVTVNPAASFTLSSSAGGLSVIQGSSNTDTISVNAANGFTGSVTLSASGLPSGVSASFGTNPVTGSSVLTLTAANTATVGGPVTITITGTAGSVTATTTVALTVNASPSFTVSPSAGTVTVVQGSSITDTITVNPANGFTGSVTLSASGLPSGVTASFGTNPATGSSVLTLTAAGTATLGGPTTVTITGTAGALTASTTVALTVSAGPTFVVGGGSSSVSIVAGATTGNTVAITVTPSNGFTGTVNLTCSIIPAAASDPPICTLTPSSVTITGTDAQSSTLTISTTAATSARNQLKNLLWPSAGTSLALLALIRFPRRRRNWLTMFGVLALVVTFGVIGCGGGGGNSGGGGGGGGGGGNSGTTPGIYTVTVTGTSGTITGTVGTVNLTVQ